MFCCWGETEGEELEVQELQFCVVECALLLLCIIMQITCLHLLCCGLVSSISCMVLSYSIASVLLGTIFFCLCCRAIIIRTLVDVFAILFQAVLGALLLLCAYWKFVLLYLGGEWENFIQMTLLYVCTNVYIESGSPATQGVKILVAFVRILLSLSNDTTVNEELFFSRI